MENSPINKIRDVLNNKLFQHIDRKILIYLIFVAISTVFWFLNELSNNYNSTINYPVRFINIPENKVLVSDLPKKLKLGVNAYGYTLLRYKISPASFPIIINLNEFGNNISKPSVKKFRLQTRNIRQSIARQLPNDIEVIEIFPDTITFQFANIIEKRVPIRPNVSLKFNEECLLNGNIYFEPDSITVKGPNSILDTLNAVYSKYQQFDGLTKAIQRNVALQEINKLSYSKKRIVMFLPVSKFTQASFNVPIQAINLPDTLELKPFPRYAKLTCLVALNDYDKIDANQFKIEVDFNDIKKLLGAKLTLNLSLAPNNVKAVNYSPQSIEFILDKKQ